MISRQRNKKPLIRFFVGAVLILGVLYVIAEPFAKIVYTIVNPVLRGVDTTISTILSIPEHFRSVSSLNERIVMLENENQALRNDQALNNVIKSQYEKVVGLSDRPSTTRSTVASVTSKPPHTPYDIITLDAGRRDGVLVGDDIIVNNIVIGSIIEVRESLSRGKLLSSPDSVFVARLGQQDIEVHGQGGGRYFAAVSKATTVYVGDVIVSPQRTSSIVGFVEYIDADPGDTFQNVYFNIPVIFESLQFVVIQENAETTF